MSRLLLDKEDVKLASVKASVELLLSEITKQNRELFTHRELEDMLLDIYNLAKQFPDLKVFSKMDLA